MTPIRSTFAALLLLVVPAISAAGKDQPGKNAGPWGEPVDGIACRLTLLPHYVTGQNISVVIEIKNTSDQKRYLVPRLEPMAIEWLTLEITGPAGKVKQLGFGRGYGLGEGSFQPMGPGEIKRHDTVDLRDLFGELPPGKYTAKFHFRSPVAPAKFLIGQKAVNGKVENIYKDVPAEIIAKQWAKSATSAPVAFEIAALAKDDLVVHEWGVFTVFNDVKYANVNRKQEWGSLPSFFYRQFPTERLRWVPSAWDKPVVYFYAKKTPMKVNVKVTFTEGAPVVWWPAVASPVDDPYLGKKPVRPFRSLIWEAWLGDEVPRQQFVFPNAVLPPQAPGPNAKVTDFPLPADCWLQDARLPGATRLTVIGNVEGPGRVRFPGGKDRSETERFLYYDGLVPAPSYLRCEKIDAKSVTMSNRAKFDIGPLFFVDRRGKDGVGFAALDGKTDVLKAGASRKIEMKPIPAADWPSVGLKQVRQALLGAGLFEPEADSLLKLWDKQFLQSEGVTAFHLLPASEYDRMLPLEIRPAPASKPVRVGIALHPHVEIEPALTETVAVLIRQLDSPQFEKRAAADKALGEVGPLAIALLRAELKKGLPLETTRRIQAVLERVDAADWLELPKGLGEKK